jgi:uncharacterized protein DUF1543
MTGVHEGRTVRFDKRYRRFFFLGGGVAPLAAAFLPMSLPLKLFAVYLGGRAPRCNTELHDVVFVTGETIEATYEQLLTLWFGSPAGLHLDSWIELRVVDGFRVGLSATPSASGRKLFFINLGAYLPGQFTELHANAFVVAESAQAVKTRAKSELLRGTQSLHTDDLYDLDDCLEVSEVGGHHVTLEPTTETQPFEPNNGYHVIPSPMIAAYLRRHPERASS